MADCGGCDSGGGGCAETGGGSHDYAGGGCSNNNHGHSGGGGGYFVGGGDNDMHTPHYGGASPASYLNYLNAQADIGSNDQVLVSATGEDNLDGACEDAHGDEHNDKSFKARDDDEAEVASSGWCCFSSRPNLFKESLAHGHQHDCGALQCCLIQDGRGIIPGKLNQSAAWYAYNGKECRIPAVRYRVKPLAGKLLPEGSPRPSKAHGWEKLKDGTTRSVWAAVAMNTPHGNVPGKVLPDGRCFYSYDCRQVLSKQYRYLENSSS